MVILTANAPTAPDVGERVELGRYPVHGGERILYGQRIRGVPRVTDLPADGLRGRALLIHRRTMPWRELQAIVADYLAQARKLGKAPALAGC
jgi:hypothetical protein